MWIEISHLLWKGDIIIITAAIICSGLDDLSTVYSCLFPDDHWEWALYIRLKVEMKPSCPVWMIFNKSHTFKESMGNHIVLLYEAVDWEALSTETFGHGADQHFSVAFPSVLWESVEQPHGTVIIQQNPGHRLPLLISDAAWWEVADQELNVVVTFLVPSKLPGVIHQVNMGKI